MAGNTERSIEERQQEESKVPVFAVLKNGAILKNIVVTNKPPSSETSFSGAKSMTAGENDHEDEEILIVGSHPDCHIVLLHPSISGSHLQINSKPSSQKLFATDLSSVHGTWVSDMKIEPGQRVELNEGDTIRVGGSATVYRLHWKPFSRAYDTENSFVSASDLKMIDEKDEESAAVEIPSIDDQEESEISSLRSLWGNISETESQQCNEDRQRTEYHYMKVVPEGVNSDSLFTSTETLSLSTTEETSTLVLLRKDHEPVNLSLLDADRGVSGYIEFLELFPTQFQSFDLNDKRRIIFLPLTTDDSKLTNVSIKTGSSLLTIYTRIKDLYFIAFQAKGKEMQLPFKIGEELFSNVNKGAWKEKVNDNKHALQGLSYRHIKKLAQVDTIDDLDLSIGGIKNAVIQLSEDNCSEDLRSSSRSILIILYGVFEAVRFKPYRNLVIFNTYQQFNRMWGGMARFFPFDPKFNWNCNHAVLSEKAKQLNADHLVWNWSELCSLVFEQILLENIDEDMNLDIEFDESKDVFHESDEDYKVWCQDCKRCLGYHKPLQDAPRPCTEV